MSPAIKTLIILAVVAVFFVTELIPLAVTSMGGAIACGLVGVIPIKTVFSGLSNSTVVLFAGMFVISAAMFHTGLAQLIGERVVRALGTGENSLMLGVMAIGAIMSSVSSNTGTCAALLPVIIGICTAAKIPAKRQLMPLAFGCGIGGGLVLGDLLGQFLGFGDQLGLLVGRGRGDLLADLLLLRTGSFEFLQRGAANLVGA